MTNQFFEQFQCNNVIDKFSFFLVCILRGEGEGKALLSQLFFWGIFLIGYRVSTPNDHGRMLFHGNFFFFFWTRSKLGDYKCRKVTEPDFWKKFLIWRYLRKGLQISPQSVMVGWLVGWECSFLRNGSKVFSDFLHKAREYKGRKVAGAGFLKKILDLEIFAKGSTN